MNDRKGPEYVAVEREYTCFLCNIGEPAYGYESAQPSPEYVSFVLSTMFGISGPNKIKHIKRPRSVVGGRTALNSSVGPTVVIK